MEHVLGAVVEVVFELSTRVSEEVDHCSLLNEVELLVDADVLHLLFGMLEMQHLVLFNNISPLGAQLLGLVAGVHIIEDCKLGAEHESEMADFNVAEVKGEQKLVVEDHVPNPFVVGPTTKTRDRGN